MAPARTRSRSRRSTASRSRNWSTRARTPTILGSRGFTRCEGIDREPGLPARALPGPHRPAGEPRLRSGRPGIRSPGLARCAPRRPGRSRPQGISPCSGKTAFLVAMMAWSTGLAGLHGPAGWRNVPGRLRSSSPGGLAGHQGHVLPPQPRGRRRRVERPARRLEQQVGPAPRHHVHVLVAAASGGQPAAASDLVASAWIAACATRCASMLSSRLVSC